MRDPTTTTDRVKELTAIQYLCQRELLELNDAINASWARQPTTAEELSIEMAIARRILERGLRPPARKRGRPQQRDRHLQIAGAVAMLVEDEGLKPTPGVTSGGSWRVPLPAPSSPPRSNSLASVWTSEPSKASGIDTVDRP